MKRRVVLSVVLPMGIGLAGCAVPSVPPWPAATRDGRWEQDLDYLAHNLPRPHKNAFHTVTKEQFDDAVSLLKEEVADLDDEQIVVRVMQVVALVGDGHTRVGGKTGIHTYPLRFRRFSDGVFVVAATEALQDTVGGRVVSVDGTPTAEALERIATAMSHDNDEELYEIGATNLALAELLYGLGVTGSPGRARFVLSMASESRVEVEVERLETTDGVEWFHTIEGRELERPLFRQRTDEPYWFVYDAEQSLCYIAYNSCASSRDYPFRRFASEVLAVIDEAEPRKVVVDLRHNSGGNSRVIRPLLEGLRRREAVNRPGRLACLIGRYTYSSAMLNALAFQQRTNALLVGEPTGGKPNSYGEVRSFTLPNSELVVTYSTKYFRPVRDGDPAAVKPDVVIETSSEDYFSGVDPVLEYVLTAGRGGAGD